MRTLLTIVLLALAATGFAADKAYPLETCIVSGNKADSRPAPHPDLH
jgi:hypothetical protein